MTFDTEAFNQFLHTGKLGGLTTGMHTAEVIAVLGAPEASAVQVHSTFTLDLYDYTNGTLQLTFMDDVLNLLGVYFSYTQNRVYTHSKRRRPLGNLPIALGVTWYPAVHGMTYRTFVAYVRQHDIACQRIVAPNMEFTDDEGYAVEVESSGMHVIFAEGTHDGVSKILHAPTMQGRYKYQPLT